jgi:orotidine-5'-phosphate decarboxylase
MTKMSRIDPPLCVALDVPDLPSATKLVDQLSGLVPVFKIGLELFCSEGPAAVSAVRDRGHDVFLDLKINDIPRQAEGAVRSARRIGVSYLTVHANGGRTMLRAARDAAEEPLRLLAVSVLTSLVDADLAELGVERGTGRQVFALAEMAAEEQMDGVVLSASELADVRSAHTELLLVTPGIRPGSSDAGDQRRVSTPAGAIAAGADLLVVGRPITAAVDPKVAAQNVLAEIEGARAHARSGA